MLDLDVAIQYAGHSSEEVEITFTDGEKVLAFVYPEGNVFLEIREVVGSIPRHLYEVKHWKYTGVYTT